MLMNTEMKEKANDIREKDRLYQQVHHFAECFCCDQLGLNA